MVGLSEAELCKLRGRGGGKGRGVVVKELRALQALHKPRAVSWNL